MYKIHEPISVSEDSDSERSGGYKGSEDELTAEFYLGLMTGGEQAEEWAGPLVLSGSCNKINQVT